MCWFNSHGFPSYPWPENLKIPVQAALQPAAGQRGLYLWGGTGTGSFAAY
jgi:predicted ATPase